jgi:hypothetical protein
VHATTHHRWQPSRPGPDCTKRRQKGFFLDQSIELPEQSRAKYKWWVNLPLCIAEPDKNKTNN